MAKNGLYKLGYGVNKSTYISQIAYLDKNNIWNDWLAHASYVIVHKLSHSQVISVPSIDSIVSYCTTCALAKTQKLHFMSTHINVVKPFELLYIEI